MTDLYIGNRKIKEVRLGNEIVPLIYKGSQLIYSKYNENQVLFESSTAGTYNLDILISGVYEVYVIGGGSGSLWTNIGVFFGSSHHQVRTYITGASGGGFIGTVRLEKGQYSILVGGGSIGNDNTRGYRVADGGNSAIINLDNDNMNIYANGGGGGTNASKASLNGDNNGIVGIGGSVSLNNTPITTTLNQKGNDGVMYKLGSAYPNYPQTAVYQTYGKGGDIVGGYKQDGYNGYVKIIYKGLGE